MGSFGKRTFLVCYKINGLSRICDSYWNHFTKCLLFRVKRFSLVNLGQIHLILYFHHSFHDPIYSWTNAKKNKAKLLSHFSPSYPHTKVYSIQYKTVNVVQITFCQSYLKVDFSQNAKYLHWSNWKLIQWNNAHLVPL